jgi:transketolase
MALAPLMYVLWTKFMKFNPKEPNWLNRDRFILSNGHASMLLYSMLHLAKYDLSLEDIKNFRQWGSKTPGHPEVGHTPGVETTTGPLGQGLMNAVGMAMAEAHLSSLFNREAYSIYDHFTYAICSDGDLMEGASHEAGSLAGHLGLGKLICFYDDNHISIEGETEITYNDDVVKRFESYGWQVENLGEKANDLEAIEYAIERAQKETRRPTLIVVRSHIGFGAPTMQDTPEAHGSPLGEEEIQKTKEFYGWPKDKKFWVPDEVEEHMKQCIDQKKENFKKWSEKFELYQSHHEKLYQKLESYLNQSCPKNWHLKLPHFEPADGPMATRSACGKALQSFEDDLPWLVGGSADLKPSTKTFISSSDYFSKDDYTQRNIAWGIREHLMCAASSGIYLHGGLRSFSSTFFIFTDYARPAIRLSALMNVPNIYVMTHDSIGLGEDGPTHQPIEQLSSFRAMPNMTLIRPADANETAVAWRVAIENKTGPTLLVLTRQKLPIFDHRKVAESQGVMQGGYVLSKEEGEKPDVILIATGSEVHSILEAQTVLKESKIDARVVSMPSWEIFRSQLQDYKNQVIPESIEKRVSVEAGSTLGWQEWIGDRGLSIGLDDFGTSAPYEEIFKQRKMDVESLVKRIKDYVKS